MSADLPTAAAIRRMQDAALERALVAGDHDGRYVAFAGALERLRRRAAEDGSSGLLTPLLAGAALAGDRSPTVGAADPWTPALDGDHPRVDGAILAVRRFDVGLDRGAQLAGRSRSDFESILRERDADGA